MTKTLFYKLMVILLFSSCTTKTIEGNYAIVERLPKNLAQIPVGAPINIQFEKGFRKKHVFKQTDFEIIYLDENKNQIFFDQGQDLMTIVTPGQDTIGLLQFDTLKKENFFQVNGQTIVINEENRSKKVIDAVLHERKKVIADNIMLDRVENFSYFDFEGQPNLVDFKKFNLVYLYFWSPRCSPCLASMDLFNDYYEQLDIKIIALVNPKDQEKAKIFLASENYKFNLGIAPEDLISYTGVSVYPKGFLINSNGKICFTATNIHPLELKQYDL